MKEEKKQKDLKKFNKKLNSSKTIQKEFNKKAKNGLPDILLAEPFSLKKFFKDEDYRKTWSFSLPHFPLDLGPKHKPNLTDLLFDNSKKKSVNKEVKNVNVADVSRKIMASLAVLAVSITCADFAVKYTPSLANWAINAIRADLLPPTKINPDFDYNTNKPNNIIDTNNSTSNNQTDSIGQVEINAEAKVAYRVLKNILNSTSALYCGEETTLTPLFLFPETRKDGSSSLKLFCKAESNICYMFEYDVYDETAYFEIFYNPNIDVANVINALSILCADENLADMPQKYTLNDDNKIVYGCISPVSKVTEHTTVGGNYDENGNYIGGGEYVEQKYYKFNTFNVELNGEIVGTQIKIKVEDAEALESFNEGNLNSLIAEYKNGNPAFVKDFEYEAGNNAATTIMYNANKQVENVATRAANSDLQI